MTAFLHSAFRASAALAASAMFFVGAFAFAANVSFENVFEAASFPFAHAATLVETPDGGLLCAWFSGEREKSFDTSIWISKRSNGVWGEPREVANGLDPVSRKRYAAWNPVLWKNPKGEIVLTYKVGDSPRMWKGFFKTSRDGGATWSAVEALPEGFLGAVKNKPVVLKSGRIVAPSSTEFHSAFGWRSHFEYSDDGGATWKISAPRISWIETIQPAIILEKDGVLRALMRSRDGYVAQSVSRDGGVSWAPLSQLKIHNPNSGLDAAALADGRFVLVCNPQKNGRNKLSVFISPDGESWREAAKLEDGADGEGYSYPSVLQTSDGALHIVYSDNLRRIKHATLNPWEL